MVLVVFIFPCPEVRISLASSSGMLKDGSSSDFRECKQEDSWTIRAATPVGTGRLSHGVGLCSDCAQGGLGCCCIGSAPIKDLEGRGLSSRKWTKVEIIRGTEIAWSRVSQWGRTSGNGGSWVGVREAVVGGPDQEGH